MEIELSGDIFIRKVSKNQGKQKMFEIAKNLSQTVVHISRFNCISDSIPGVTKKFPRHVCSNMTC